MSRTPLTVGGRRRLMASAATAVLALVGVVLIIVAVAAQRSAPQPTRSAAGSIGPSAPRPTGGPGTPAPATGHPATRGPIASASASPEPPRLLPPSPPVFVAIPAISVRSRLLHTGVAADGTLAVPTSFQVAAWFRYSSRPGTAGPAIILGHVDSYRGPGVFYRLGALRPGDLVHVGRADHRTATYRITGVRSYPKGHLPTRALYRPTRYAAIRLITCGGSFDTATRHYRSDIVAFGVLTGS